ncbi:hypothetical protein EOPP23_15890 [Endozoicomonas sp. OPT23]|uniref:hypothetical protein n=1 Tax=Endozoicomonas sp. OPT23 TaxID=2072845 RepID=UPI00129B6296|nr:hypothetical protein [Endozoicomonas sp. OPT23]MRI34468.1 hypothetical protein [Endozoicomonas sp. OPT23]
MLDSIRTVSISLMFLSLLTGQVLALPLEEQKQEQQEEPDLVSVTEPSTEKKIIKNVPNHPYSTVTSKLYPLALVSGETGATLVDYEQGRIVATLNLNGSAANSGLFVTNGGDEIIYVMAFNNLPGAGNTVYAFPLRDGKVSSDRLEVADFPGDIFPGNSFSLAADNQGEYVYFVSLETSSCDDSGHCTGKRWLNQVTVSDKDAKSTAIEMPAWHGYSADGGDHGLSLTANGETAYLAHNRETYQVTGLKSNVQPVIKSLPIDYGDANLINSTGSQLLVFSYGDILEYSTQSWQKRTLLDQSGSSQSFIQNAQFYVKDQKALFTLQDISGQSTPLKHSPRQIAGHVSSRNLFPPNEVVSINVNGEARAETLYQRFFTGPYPTSACWSHDEKYLLITLWNELKDTTELAIYSSVKP